MFVDRQSQYPLGALVERCLACGYDAFHPALRNAVLVLVESKPVLHGERDRGMVLRRASLVHSIRK